MTWPKYLLKSILVALNLYFSTEKKTYLFTETVIVREVDKKKEKKRLLIKHNPLPRQRFRKERLLRHQKHTSSKDARYSNQRKLRRMYRNT